MKKKHRLVKLLLVFSLILTLTGCTSLDYVDTDAQTIKSSRIQTSENFNLQIFQKSIEGININAGISETVLDAALVLYMSVQNNTDVRYKFDIADISVTSPVGEISIIPTNIFIDGFYNYEASTYNNFSNAGAALGNFTSIQNARYSTGYSSISTKTQNTNPEMEALENTIRGIQKHALNSYKYVNPNSTEYFYIFIRKPDEYPIVVNYKTINYKFGGRENAQR